MSAGERAAPVSLARQSIEAQRDAAAAALAAGVIAAMGFSSLDDAMAVFDAIRARLYGEADDAE